MHLFGDVGGGVLHHDGLRPGNGRESEPVIIERAGSLGGDPFVAQGEVDEAWPANLRRVAHVGHVDKADEFAGEFTWRAAYSLGQRQRRVGLEIGECRGPDQRVGVAVFRAERRDDGVVYPLGENLLWIGHAFSLSVIATRPPIAAEGSVSDPPADSGPPLARRQ